MTLTTDNFNHPLEFYTFQKFLKELKLPPKISKEEFRKRIVRKNRVPDKSNPNPPNAREWKVRKMTLDNFIELFKKKKPNDPRFEVSENLWESRNKFDELVDSLYFLFVSNREHTLRVIFNSWFRVKHNIRFYASMNPNFKGLSEKDGTIFNLDSGATKYGRILKNYFLFDQIKLNKVNTGGGFNLYETCVTPFKDYVFSSTHFSPAFIKVLNERIYTSMIGFWHGIGSYASILNPYLSAYCLKKVLNAKKLFTPVLSWGSYSVAGINLKLEEHVGVDVIPEVCNFAENIYPFFESEVKHKMYCCPSEKLDERHDFSNKYKNHFDTVFFCPPYYNLEWYEGGEQSHESFQTYEQWLEGYWRPTVELCKRVLQKGGTFSFIISNYKDHQMKPVPISEDMLRIASEYFKLKETKRIQHQLQSKKHLKKMSEGNFEQFHIMTKV